MKFAAILRDSATDLPDAEDLFRKYKHLKKSLKRIPALHPSTATAAAAAGEKDDHSSEDEHGQPGPSDRKRNNTQSAADGAAGVTATNIGHQQQQEQADAPADAAPPDNDHEAAEYHLDPALEAEFIRAITADVMELNERYIEKEEDMVIRFGNLNEQVTAAATNDDEDAKVSTYRALVEFHGELLMLLHWSILAYTGLVKILKKHRKRTGAPLHAPHLENLLAQPFCSVEVICDMVRQAEECVSSLAGQLGISPPELGPLPDLLDTAGGELGGNGVGVGNGVGGENGETLGGAGVVGSALGQQTSDRNTNPSADAGADAGAGAGNAETTGGAGGGDVITTRETSERETLTSAAAAGVRGSGSGIAHVGDKRPRPEGLAALPLEAAAAAAAPLAAAAGVQQHPPPPHHHHQGHHQGHHLSSSPLDTQGARRVRAALDVWQKLQNNVSTPSTVIAASAAAREAAAAEAEAGAGQGVAANLSNSSAVE